MSQNTSADDQDLTETVFDRFMLEEYKTIASAHFDLHSGLRQYFRFYLGLVALPFTVMAVAFRDTSLTLFALPQVLLLVFFGTPTAGLALFISMVNTRFDVILYTRAVNGVRAYFVQRAAENGRANVSTFLKLPTDMFRPPYLETYRRPYWWQFATIAMLNGAYLFIGLANWLELYGAVTGAVVFILMHAMLYRRLGQTREADEIPRGRMEGDA